jgi:imidazolonepropionase-like amidohydrolase
VPGLALHRELAALVSAGLTPADAIRAATSVPAGTLGVASTLGQVLPGFRADLLLVRGDPLADVGALREVARVIRGGEILDRQALLASARRAAGPGK